MLFCLSICLTLLLLAGCNGVDIEDINDVDPDPDEYTLEMMEVEGQGEVEPDVGTHTFDPDTLVDLLVTPDTGWEFDEWAGPDSGDVVAVNIEDGEYRIEMDSNKEIYPIFKTNILLVPSQYSTIQEAIDASDHGDKVIVDQGIYKENINLNGKNITIRSTDPEDPDIVETTVIDGDDDGQTITINSGETEDALIYGFKITGGNAGDRNYGGGILIAHSSSPIIKGNIITENIAGRGAGIYVNDQSSPTIKNNIFIENDSTSRWGAAIYVRDNSEVLIQDNILRDHTEVRGVIAIGSSSTDNCIATISGNTIENNFSDYGTGGIHVSGSDVVIDNNTFTNNIGDGAGIDAGGAISVIHNSSVEINDNTFTNNSASQFGAIVIGDESSAKIKDNTITDNVAGEFGEGGSGGGISINDTELEEIIISGNTIIDNTAGNAGGGLYIRETQNIVIEENEISNNKSYRFGGGIDLRGHGFDSDVIATIINNTISENEVEGHRNARGGGILVRNIQEATIYGNKIDNNFAGEHGGGIYIFDEIPVFASENIPWDRSNCPPDDHNYNDFSDNSHGDNQYGGADVFFAENR